MVGFQKYFSVRQLMLFLWSFLSDFGRNNKAHMAVDEFLKVSELNPKGSVTFFASARMALVSVLSCLKLGPGDEVVLAGSTCAVVATSISRIGATPVFSDISPDTYGSDQGSCISLVNNRTRAIIFQHSHGIPSDCRAVCDFARNRGIVLIEDCSLTVGSKYMSVPAGSSGDAAIFSTDSSKPIACFTGGVLYCRGDGLLTGFRKNIVRPTEPPISARIWFFAYLVFSSLICHLLIYRHSQTVLSGVNKFFKPRSIRRDFDSYFSESHFVPGDIPPIYSPPPFFYSAFLIQTRNWYQKRVIRKETLSTLVALMTEVGGQRIRLPSCYLDDRYDIDPLRMVINCNCAETYKIFIECFDERWFWFKENLQGASGDVASLYSPGLCPTAESLTHLIVNIPCDLSDDQITRLGNLLKLQGVNDV